MTFVAADAAPVGPALQTSAMAISVLTACPTPVKSIAAIAKDPGTTETATPSFAPMNELTMELAAMYCAQPSTHHLVNAEAF